MPQELRQLPCQLPLAAPVCISGWAILLPGAHRRRGSVAGAAAAERADPQRSVALPGAVLAQPRPEAGESFTRQKPPTSNQKCCPCLKLKTLDVHSSNQEKFWDSFLQFKSGKVLGLVPRALFDPRPSPPMTEPRLVLCLMHYAGPIRAERTADDGRGGRQPDEANLPR